MTRWSTELPISNATAIVHAWRWPRRTPRATNNRPSPAMATSAAAASGTASGTIFRIVSSRLRSGGVTADAMSSTPAKAMAADARRRVRRSTGAASVTGGHDGPLGNDDTTSGTGPVIHCARTASRSTRLAPGSSVRE